MEGLLLEPIGIIRTPFKDKYAAPRQPFAEGIIAQGKIVLNSGHNFEQALADLDGFEKIWLIYQFDRNKNWKPKVLPPRGSSEKRGVFATRSPHRPNPLGLSLVTLLGIKGRSIYIDGVDMLDKTPIFDIKPYLPLIESYPNARTGWVEPEKTELASREIQYSESARMILAKLTPQQAIQITSHIEHSLRYEIAPHPYKRIESESGGGFILSLKTWRIKFVLAGYGAIMVLSIEDNSEF
ncbi:MAG TPA: tRNA (N6-threonylcarbamoyladenosine(37)-N6)-methyltransferase TrmO [Candidatus Kapabacteria bacterium]|nr:tRNA (N6-threonylcarbamoyladenosine(37)-N6)-methyltransferase TrmO [Candidatus Kapabacteria bacterium]